MSVGCRSDNGKEFHSFGEQAAKLRGPKVEVRQASSCRSPRAAERKWRSSCDRNTQLEHTDNAVACITADPGCANSCQWPHLNADRIFSCKKCIGSSLKRYSKV